MKDRKQERRLDRYGCLVTFAANDAHNTWYNKHNKSRIRPASLQVTITSSSESTTAFISMTVSIEVYQRVPAATLLSTK